MVNGVPICATDAEREMLANDGSYPSGHAAVGWAWALILTELAPDRADAILARGREFAQSRVVCNVHWQSDVLEGRAIGAAAVARLHADAAFQADLAAAREELAAVRAKALPPSRDCAAEASALAARAPDAIWPMPR
jgi:acid phosphatase (class A)